MKEQDNLRLVIAVVLSIIVMQLSHYLFPSKTVIEKEDKIQKSVQEKKHTTTALLSNSNTSNSSNIKAKEISVENEKIQGVISNRGITISDIFLKCHKKDINNCGNIKLLSSCNTQELYTFSLGFDIDKTHSSPGEDTLWNFDQNKLLINHPVTFTWNNKQGIQFYIKMELDENYIIHVNQRIVNNSSDTVRVRPNCLLKKSLHNASDKKSGWFSGMAAGGDDISQVIGAINGSVEEFKYESVLQKKFIRDAQVDWIGNSDKYWMCSFIPEKSQRYDLHFSSKTINEVEVFLLKCSQSEYEEINKGKETNKNFKVFLGAKEVKVLDKYKDLHKIKLLDRAVDFGWLYFLTKPLFYLLSFFNSILKNYGYSIILLTFLIKLVLFPLLRRSEASMKSIKDLQPKIEELKKRYGGSDSQTFRQELIALYKKENVSPFGFSMGCLPMILQIPLWYSVYKVLYVAIDLRHSPFILWIKDLSAPDSAYIFNFFGLLNFNLPSFLQIGILPFMCGGSLFLQQKLSTQVLDPVQQRVFKFFPIIFIFIFASSSSGLVLYWTFSNILGILQQLFIKFVLDRKILSV